MKLFEPMTIGSMTLKNRIVMPPMQLVLGLQNRRVGAYYMERAQGGVGTIIMHATSVDLLTGDEAWGRPGGLKGFLEKTREFTNEIRKTGAKIGIQLWHGNQFPAGSGAAMPGGAKLAAPSKKDGMKAFTGSEIKTIIGKFSSATAAARESGFDFVEFHGAHGYLLNQFFSGADNQRTDKYGGDVHARMRFGLEIVEASRAAVGYDYPLFFRIAAEEKRTGGITPKQGRLYAVALAKAGIDLFDVSIGHDTGRSPSPSKRAKMGTFVHLAEAIKRDLKVPVMAVGRINTPEIAESILTGGRADLVGIGRQLITDPYWPKKVLEGRENEIIACESCNTCFRPLLSGKWRPGDQVCKVNERAGREIDIPLSED